ncbi:branched-chain amino acid ABC transporter permease [Enemella dayhoffiae]|uniref:Branched-chain amino acid ABC transporter permease n=1 Tax=Enemella dayhoffiae TaxID=2016507 RepID=A0A255HE92_9ACTN|nr:branched-chain amino acid ABC transporter permease [Enemella dayhoffiae]OYO24674.1 branched-chain amino acid ABC transporter permease [Enemella dayhoffiae]
MSSLQIFKPEQQERLQGPGRILALVGAVLMIVSPYLAWSYGADALDDMTYWGGPSPLQMLFLIISVLLLVALVGHFLVGRVRPLRRFAWNRAAKVAATLGLIWVVVAIVAIALELGGLVNLEPGAWVALAGALIAFVGTRMLPLGEVSTLKSVRSPSWLQILAIVVLLGVGLVGVAFGLNQDDGGSFILFIVFVFAIVLWMLRLGVSGWLGRAARENRKVLVLAAFVVAFALPFTQDGSDANMSIASQVLIFAATALGLNIVVGLAGLLDLGYIAFLGAGAFTAAVLSKSMFATFFAWKPPFIVVVLIAGCVSAILGLIIGSPTLRVSGDYLAIVTLAFGEIFRLGMLNLDGSDGPDITHGSNGIPNIPDLEVGAFNFKESHEILGVEIGRFANYYWLMLLVLALIILVFANLNRSRIGRGWVAIREDEKAAEAMGVNVFGLKLLAFAGGAFLAGVAGSVKAHADVSVTPDQYMFLESAFLLAAVVLGGMGTIVGVLAGATMLKLLPEKLRAVSDYRLLIFGLLLVVMMRFRPEGLIPDKRHQLELHDDEELPPAAESATPASAPKETTA